MGTEKEGSKVDVWAKKGSKIDFFLKKTERGGYLKSIFFSSTSKKGDLKSIFFHVSWKTGAYTAEPTHHPHIMSTPEIHQPSIPSLGVFRYRKYIIAFSCNFQYRSNMTQEQFVTLGDEARLFYVWIDCFTLLKRGDVEVCTHWALLVLKFVLHLISIFMQSFAHCCLYLVI